MAAVDGWWNRLSEVSSSREEARRTDEFYDIEADSYDAFFSDPVEDMHLIRALAKDTGGPILEIMSGTGRLLLPLAREGYEVWGLDVNEAMLNRAKAKLSEESVETQARVHLCEGDARSFRLGRKFPFIVVTFGSLLHLQEEKDREACLRNALEHLASGGLFFVAIPNWSTKPLGPYVRLASTTRVLWSAALAHVRTWPPMQLARLFAGTLGTWLLRHPGGRITWIKAVPIGPGAQVVRVVFTKVDSDKRTMTKEVRYEVLGRRGPRARRVARLSLAVISRKEMESSLDHCGFSIVKMMGGFRREPFRNDSELQVYLCRRRGEEATP